MEGYVTCEKCNGRGVLLNTIRNHWVDNPICVGKDKCQNLQVSICKKCNGDGQILWIDVVIPKKHRINFERISTQLKEIFDRKIIISVISGDVKGNVDIILAERNVRSQKM